MNNLTFGRFTPFNTVVHRLDPRNKIFLVILLMVSIFLKVDVWSTTLIMSAILLFILIVFMLIARVSFISLFKSLKTMWMLLIFLFIIYIFIPNATYNPEHIAFYIGTYGINYDAFFQVGYIFIRIVMMLMITMILTSTTSPMNLTYGLEWYMSPLKLVKFPETDRIIKAQSSRGVDFQRGGFIKRFGAIISLIIPLFVSAINRSEDLSNAMEARGYDPYAKRSRYRILKFHWKDLFALILVLAIFGGVLTLVIYDKNVAQVDFIFWIFCAKPLFYWRML